MLATAEKEPKQASISAENSGQQKMTMENTELLTSHFGFVPSEFVDDVINSINSLLYAALAKMLESVSAAATASTEASTEPAKPRELTDEQRSQIETLFEHSIDKHFDKFELYCLKNVFTIPKHAHLHLPNYADYAQMESGQLDKVRETIFAERYYQYRLVTELEAVNRRIQEAKDLKSRLATVKPVLGKTGQIAEQMTKLHATLLHAKKDTSDGKFVQVLADADERLLLLNQTKTAQDASSETTGREAKGSSYHDYSAFAKDFSRAVRIGNLEENAKVFLLSSSNHPAFADDD